MPDYRSLAHDGSPSAPLLTSAASRVLGAPQPAIGTDALVDEGFAGSTPFDMGRVTLRAGSAALDLSTLQQPLSTGQALAGAAAVLGCLVTPPFGWAYLCRKATMVRPGEVALVRSITGETRALGPGFHLLATVGAEVKKAAATSPSMSQGTLTILRVLPGELGRGQLAGAPLLLLPGVHLINDALFSFAGTVPATTPHISVGGTLHVITVGRNQVGLCLANAQGHLLGAGRHAIYHERFEFCGLRSLRDEYLTVGSKHRVFLPEGRLGLAWDGGRPLILEPAADQKPLCIDSPTFSFEKSVPATQLVIQHGALKLVTVRQGFVGISFADGVLQVLPPGRSTLSSVTHAFSGFLPTGQQNLPVASVDGMTADNVGLQFDAAICVQIVDAQKAIMTLSTTAASARAASAPGGEVGFDSESIWNAVKARARLSLSIIIGNNRLNRGNADDAAHQPGRGVGVTPAGLGPAPAAARAAAEAGGGGKAGGGAAFAALAGGGGGGSGGDAGDPAPAADASASFRTLIHDSFMTNFAQRMYDECGVAVIDMSLEDVRITDTRLAEAMARGAVARADLAKANIEKSIKVTNAMADKEAAIVAAEGRASSTQIVAAAEASRVRLMDETFARALAPLTQQREALLASGEVLRAANATLIFSASPADAAALLAASSGAAAGGAGGALLRQQQQQQQQQLLPPVAARGSGGAVAT